MTTRTRLALALVLTATAAGGCKKKKKPVEVPEEEPTPVAAVEQALAVASVSPSTLPPNVPSTITVRGNGFQAGAKVWVGSTAATNVSVSGTSSLSASVPGLAAGTYDVQVGNPDGKSATLYQALTVEGISPECAQVTAYFDFDSFTLRGDSVSQLTQRLACWTDTTNGILVEGHADERGTIDYNLALGEKRASSVATWLGSHGVARSRVETVSYGEERPADPGHDERAWAANRRADVKLKR
jgi:peptidoglycan-associated lipoprotein